MSEVSGALALKMSGADKVAALLLAMDKSVADRMLAQFDAQELRAITRSIAQLGAVSSHMLENLIEEFTSDLSVGSDLTGSAADAERLLTGAVPSDQVAEIMAELLGSSNPSLWERIAKLPVNTLVDYLKGEHPQTAAFILSKLSSEAGADVLNFLPAVLRNDVSMRMLELKPVAQATQRLIETSLQEALLFKQAQGTGVDTQSKFAEILNKLERDQMESILGDIAQTSPEVAASVRKKLFSFEDIIKLSNRARATLFEKLQVETVILALRGCDDGLREAALSSMAARARRMVEQELASPTPVAQRDIATARRKIAETVLILAGRSEIVLDEEPDSEGQS